MKNTLCLVACLATLASATAQSPQPTAAPAATPPPPGENFNSRLQSLITRAAAPSEPALTKFSLDFPGGTPNELVAAIEKAMSKPLNAIIPPEYTDMKIPPLKMSNVDVQQLFTALGRISVKSEAYTTGGNSYQISNSSFGFRTQGQVTDDAIWYFYVEKPTLPPAQVRTSPKICRYFSLAPYLEDGQTVEDITTAIQTGWKMLGDKETPTISFHKETKLLIAVGEPEKLETIDAVLKALSPTPRPPPFIDPTTGLPVPATRPGIPQRPLKSPPTGTSRPGEMPAVPQP